MGTKYDRSFMDSYAWSLLGWVVVGVVLLPFFFLWIVLEFLCYSMSRTKYDFQSRTLITGTSNAQEEQSMVWSGLSSCNGIHTLFSFNICGLPNWISRFHQLDPMETRWPVALQLIQIVNADIVCLQEVFDPWIIAQVQRVFGYPYYVSDANALQSKLFFGSGLAVLSKYPILGYTFYPFEASAGTDRFAHKGWLVVELEHAVIINLHMQAGDEHSAIRRQQWDQMWSWWIRNKFLHQQESDDWMAFTKPVWFAGDWNMTPNEWKQLHLNYPELEWIQSTSKQGNQWMPYDAIVWSSRHQKATIQPFNEQIQRTVRHLNQLLQSSDHDPLFVALHVNPFNVHEPKTGF